MAKQPTSTQRDPSSSGPEPPARLGIGLVGTGFLAHTRARCWARVHGASVTAVVGRRADSADAFIRDRRSRDSGPRSELDRLLADPGVDVVDVCVPNALHRDITIAAARAGKHVICTKPLSAYVGQDLGKAARDDQVSGADPERMGRVAVEEGRTMVEAAEQAGIFLCYAENWIYAPSIVRAAQLLDESGAVLLEMRGGESHSGSHSDYSKLWRNTGGGALLRLGAHPIGVMLHLKRREGLRRLGRPIEPIAVQADVADLSRVEGLDPTRIAIATGWRDVENWGQATITFEDGSRGVAWGSDNRLGGMRSEMELMAADSAWQCNLSPTDQLRAYAPNEAVFGESYLIEKQSTTAGWSTPMADEDWSSGQLGMCQAFADAIGRGEAPASDGSLGVEVTRLVYAAYASAREGRRVEIERVEADG
jgi:predicted dehydrogenase